MCIIISIIIGKFRDASLRWYQAYGNFHMRWDWNRWTCGLLKIGECMQISQKCSRCFTACWHWHFFWSGQIQPYKATHLEAEKRTCDYRPQVTSSPKESSTPGTTSIQQQWKLGHWILSSPNYRSYTTSMSHSLDVMHFLDSGGWASPPGEASTGKMLVRCLTWPK